MDEPRACTAAKHTPSHRSYRLGCRCPATIDRLHQLRRGWDATYLAKYGRPRGTSTASASNRFVDDIAVDLAVHGHKPRLYIPERAQAIARLTRAGMSAAQIAERVGVTARTVVRHRQKGREAA